MAKCGVCGNGSDKSLTVTLGGRSHTFDSFECAMEKLAPRCERCDCRIVGHGVEVEGRFYCCAHCARAVAELGNQIRDAVGVRPS